MFLSENSIPDPDTDPNLKLRIWILQISPSMAIMECSLISEDGIWKKDTI